MASEPAKLARTQTPHLLRVQLSAVPTLAESIDEFLLDMGVHTRTTQIYYADEIGRCFRDFFAPRVADVSEITAEMFREYIRGEQKKGLSANTVQHRYVTAKRFLTWCVEQDWIDVNPADRVRAPKVPELLRESFNKDEVSRLLRATTLKRPGWIAQRDRAIVVTLFGTAMRASELLGLKLTDLDFANRLILIMGKGQKQRKVRMGTGVYKALRDYLRVRPRSPLTALWVTQHRTAMHYGTMHQMLGFLGERADVPNCIAHRFRHTAAVAYYREHRDIRATMGLLRHSQVTTTMRYLKGLGVDYETDAGFATPDEFLAGM